MESTKNYFKKFIKNKIHTAAFKYLLNLSQTHSKVKNIEYEKHETQKYMLNSTFSNQEVNLLHAFRSRTVRGIRTNFRIQYSRDLSCPLVCWPPNTPPIEDSQQHLMVCSKLQGVFSDCQKVQYGDIFGNVTQQKSVILILSRLLEERDILLSENEATSGATTLDPVS